MDDLNFCCGITVNDLGIFDSNVAAELSMTTLPLVFSDSAHDHMLLCVACWVVFISASNADDDDAFGDLDDDGVIDWAPNIADIDGVDVIDMTFC